VLAASIIVAAGAEAVFHLSQKPRRGVKHMSKFLTQFILKGISGWQASAKGGETQSKET
jgi:hypothetical protein